MISPGTMASGSQHTRLDGTGVRIIRAKGVRRDLWGVVIVAMGVIAGGFVLRGGEPPVPQEPVRPPAAPVVGPVAGSAGADARGTSGEKASPLPGEISRTPGARLRALRALGIEPTRGPNGKPQVDARPVIEALNRAGVHDGIAAFPPPGTDPPKSGIIVPDGFELPEGYLRYYQVTDDGEALPPILVLHPDYQFIDAQGDPIASPPNRVVPPELAPPGLPVQMLQIPERGRPR
jgi:hypothetical protein